MEISLFDDVIKSDDVINFFFDFSIQFGGRWWWIVVGGGGWWWVVVGGDGWWWVVALFITAHCDHFLLCSLYYIL